MVAAQDLGSCDFGRVGSSPISRTCDYSVFLDFPTFLLHRGSIRIDVFVWCFVGFLWGLLMLPTTPRMFFQGAPCGCKFRRGFTDFLRGMSLQGLEYRSDSRRYGVPSHVFSHCSNSTTKHRRVWGTPTRLLPLLHIRRVPPREVSGRQAKPAKRQFSRTAARAKSRFYLFFFVACHCRDWNTIAIRDGMGYPSHVFHCSNFQTSVLRRFVISSQEAPRA